MDLKHHEQAHVIQERGSNGNTPVKNRHCAERLLRPEEKNNFRQNDCQKNLDLLTVPSVASNDNTPTKFSSVPQSSPVDKHQEPINSRLSDSFKTEAFRALLAQLSVEKNLQEITEHSSELPTIHIVSDSSFPEYPSVSDPFQGCGDIVLTTSEDITNGKRVNVFPELKYFETDVSLSGISLDVEYGSSYNDECSLIAQCSSEASDISNETEEFLFDEDDLTFEMEKQDSKEALLTCPFKIHSPKKPLSAKGRFLNKRKQRNKRGRFSSLSAINNPMLIDDSSESELMQTI